MGKASLLATVFFSCACVVLLWAAPADMSGISAERGSVSSASIVPNIPSDQLRQLALHDAGNLYCPISCGGFAPVLDYIPPYTDPETGLELARVIYPSGSGKEYVFSGDLWVGGIVGGDTLLSQAFDNRFSRYNHEFWPESPYVGGIHRTGRFAADEFVAVFTDTVTDSDLTGGRFPFDDSPHIPMHIKVRQYSYSWKDTLYDDFVIFSYVIENIGTEVIHDGWLGIEVDPDIYYDTTQTFSGFRDDFSALLDTFLYDGDPSSHVLIPYAYDDDGDPWRGTWSSTSIRGAVSLALLETSIPDPQINFNWWIPTNYESTDFGPRRVGTAEDPFRAFDPPMLGTALKQEDRYYLLSHPERDYDQIEIKIHDSADGWIPASSDFFEIYHDTRYLYSLGSFDLVPGDSVSLVFALVVSDGIHVNPGDYAAYFDPQNPGAFRDRLDFTDLMIDHRRVDSVYRSGLTLPRPGPPQGLKIVDYDDSYVTVTWHPSGIPNVKGYFVNTCDTSYDDVWRHAHPQPLRDTIHTVPIYAPGHEYFFGVSVVDGMGRESGVSLPVALAPGQPHPPRNLAVTAEHGVPRLTWEPPDDTDLVVYMIYRAAGYGQMELYDSVSALSYRDVGAESGVPYSYAVSAANALGLQSPMIGPVSILPLALDRGLLLYDMNGGTSGGIGPYRREYLYDLINDAASVVDVAIRNQSDSELTLKEMSRYELIIVDGEKRGGKFPVGLNYLMEFYLENGGRALFIVPNASTDGIGMSFLRFLHYATGDFFYDHLHLDSAVVNGVFLVSGHIMGDLMGCATQTPDYPPLEADSQKMASAPIPIDGYLPLSGFIYPRDDVDILYRYQSCYPDSIFHNQVDGIRYIADTGSFVFFNFPLSLMKGPENVLALRRALSDLGIDVDCGDMNDDGRQNIGDAVFLVNYLYKDGPAPPGDGRADVNCDGAVDVEDALIIINAIFRGGAGLKCCP